MHELEIVDGVAKMAYAGETPWHGLGVKVSNDLTPEQMMKAAGVDWKVRELNTFAEMELDGEMTRLPTGMKALVRETDGKVLTQVGAGWHPVQNSEAFDFFKEFVDAGDMEMHTAGSLKEGKIVWALAKVDDDFTLFGGDKVESYLLFSNPHMYGKTIDIRFTPTRVCCNNTLTYALGERAKTQVKLSHRSMFDAQEVKQVMGLAKAKMEEYKKTAEILGYKQVTKDVVERYFGYLLGKSAKDETKLSRTGLQAMQYLETQPGAEYAKGSLWSAYNTITFMVDHKLGRTTDSRLTSAWYGQNARLKQNALETALKFAEAA